MIAILNPSAYTAIVAGKNAATDIGTIEVYDIGTASLENFECGKLANISTRGFVETSDNVMIRGFVISRGTTKIIARAIGPELPGRGVAGALLDTAIALVNSTGHVMISNDDWRTTQEQAIIDNHAAPTDDREAAVVVSLCPGGHTAIVQAKTGTTGVASVEMYVLP